MSGDLHSGVEIPVKGGTLWLQAGSYGRLEFRYEGFVPLDWAVELVRNSSDGPPLTVGGLPLLGWLESESARQHVPGTAGQRPR